MFMDFMFVGLWMNRDFISLFAIWAHIHTQTCMYNCCAVRTVPHKIYNNSLKRFRKQHHTRQSKLWNELTICCCVFAFMLSRLNKMGKSGQWIWWNKIKHTRTQTHQMNGHVCIHARHPMFALKFRFSSAFLPSFSLHERISIYWLLLKCTYLFFASVLLRVCIAHVCTFAATTFPI